MKFVAGNRARMGARVEHWQGKEVTSSRNERPSTGSPTPFGRCKDDGMAVVMFAGENVSEKIALIEE
jgi:hypothetical protein